MTADNVRRKKKRESVTAITTRRHLPFPGSSCPTLHNRQNSSTQDHLHGNKNMNVVDLKFDERNKDSFPSLDSLYLNTEEGYCYMMRPRVQLGM